MTTRYITAPGSAANTATAAPCGCGSVPCGCGKGAPRGGGCDCDTGCLSRPHFYCGMVLTDDQLNDLTQWVRRRSALHRYVEGWGVVRGLGVRCDPARPGCVVVGPGYARSCCGDDIVLCQDTCLEVCACQPVGPCCDQDRDDDDCRAVDLYLRYAETQQDAARVMASCGCAGHDSVEYERVAETGTLCCVPVADTATDPATLAARDWERGYAACAAVVGEYLREVSDRASTEDRLKWILRWIDRAADDALCCLRRRLCRTGLGDEGVAGTLLEIVSALRNRYLEVTYGQCRRPEGVLLARIWLGRDENGRCVVDCVDSHPPFRRVITAPGWPNLPGRVNVAGLWWQRRAIACERACQLGLKLTWRQYRPPDSVEELAELLDGDSVFAACDAEYETWLYRDRCGRWNDDGPDGRVVRLRPAAAQVGLAPAPPGPRTPAARATRGRAAARKDNP
jgi:hypothetical protein